MPHHPVRQIISLFLVVAILVAPTFCLCQELPGGDHLRVERSHAADHDSVKACGGQSQGCPGADGSGADHGASDCFGSCHLPIVAQALRIHHVPLVSGLSPIEPFTALPEVYLSKFIPPQNQA